MTVHLYTASHQPATRYRVAVGNGYRWIRRSPRSLVFACCCLSRRRAWNCTVQVYYDEVRAGCRPGKGCKR